MAVRNEDESNSKSYSRTCHVKAGLCTRVPENYPLDLLLWPAQIVDRENKPSGIVKLSEIGLKRSLWETVGDLRAKDQAGGAQTIPWTGILEDA